MYCSREYHTSTRLIQQYEKSTLKYAIMLLINYIFQINVSFAEAQNIKVTAISKYIFWVSFQDHTSTSLVVFKLLIYSSIDTLAM